MKLIWWILLLPIGYGLLWIVQLIWFHYHEIPMIMDSMRKDEE